VRRAQVAAHRISNAAFTLLAVLMIGTNVRTLIDTFGSLAIATYALFVLAMVALGLALGGNDARTRGVFALGAGQRNISAGLVVAGASFDDPAVSVMVLIASVTGLIVLFAVAQAMRRRAGVGRA
jgi:predicted Na+-dependent transporter